MNGANVSDWRKRFALAVLLLALIAPSRLIAADRPVTVDEPWWLISGSNYYYALSHRDFANTLYDYHPAVTTSWMVAVAMSAYFPEYRGFGQGYFDVRKPKFEEFLRGNSKESLDLLRYSRRVQSILILFFALIGFFLLCQLMDYRLAFLSIGLAMTAPFYLGHSRLLNHEGMLAIFAIVSLIGFHVYLEKGNKAAALLISGVAFGLAQLTKSASILLAVPAGLMLVVGLFRGAERTPESKVLDAIKKIAMWLGVAALTYILLWPGMWVDPARMLREVYGNAFSYAFQGARLDVTEELDTAQFSVVTRWDGILLYLRYWASGTTFITWLGLILASAFLFTRGKERLNDQIRSMIGYLSLLGVLFILMFGIAQGRNHAHYIMTAFVGFDVIAGIGWGSAILWLGSRWKGLSVAYAAIAASVVLILAQIGFGLPYAPYYFTYRNPLAKEAATLGYGEGLAEAADYLSQKPNADEITAYVYNGMGTFSWRFPGETLVLKRVFLINDNFEQIADDIRKSDYLVLYPITRAKHPETEKILDIFETMATPERVIFINGLEYIQIYRVADISEAIYEALAAP